MPKNPRTIAEQAVTDIVNFAKEEAYNESIALIRKYGKRAGFYGALSPVDHAIQKIEASKILEFEYPRTRGASR